MTISFRLLRSFRAAHSSLERLEHFNSKTVEFEFLNVITAFLDEEVNWPFGGVHFDFRTLIVSKMFFSEVREISSLLWKKAFSWTRRRNFSTSCLTANSSEHHHGNKI